EYDINGNMIGLINAVLDITERKVLERQKDDFMAIVAHELKTPLTSIKGYTQILMTQLSQMSDEKIVHLHERLNDQINNLAKLIDRMLNGAKIEAGDMEFKREPYDLVLLVTQVVENLRLTTTTHQLKVNHTSAIIVVGDKEYIQQVVVNLISNAIKYSPKADQVNITIKLENNMAICSVQDFGVGILSEQVSSIFEKFYRVKSENFKKFPGIGLGLYLSAEIVRQQGGAIWAESTVNKGSTFSFSLPV
ncbi:MAG TPA: HAMP domain-containing sensor histidine kinase, partial [Chryseolinea sp.]|nr:HAMP domain-containing sensor histidine kinase [Chryseolinea sp.]